MMNLLTGNFISSTEGKISLKQLLTSEQDFQLQYAFDETQLAMLQLLSSLTTYLLRPSLVELRAYIENGLTAEQYEACLANVDLELFDESRFMRSNFPANAKQFDAPITKLVSGIECGSSANAMGMFSEVIDAQVCCSDCTHVLNYNLHMNIKGECFSSTGATGIRGGGALTTLVSAESLKKTILVNTIAVDYFQQQRGDTSKTVDELMWQSSPSGEIYFAQHIGLLRGLFATAYHIDFLVENAPCTCDICGHDSERLVRKFIRSKYTGSYGSTKNGRDNGAQWWPHPYTPTTLREGLIYPVCARDQNWQSWQDFSSFVIQQENDKTLHFPAYIVEQYKKLSRPSERGNLMVGGNIADQGSITGRIYDLYCMPQSWDKNLSRVTSVIKTGVDIKDKLSQGLNKLFATDYEPNFLKGIKQSVLNEYIANAQQIIQQTLVDVDRKEAKALQRQAEQELKQSAVKTYQTLMRKYQHELPLFKALLKGEGVLLNRKQAAA